MALRDDPPTSSTPRRPPTRTPPRTAPRRDDREDHAAAYRAAAQRQAAARRAAEQQRRLEAQREAQRERERQEARARAEAERQRQAAEAAAARERAAEAAAARLIESQRQREAARKAALPQVQSASGQAQRAARRTDVAAQPLARSAPLQTEATRAREELERQRRMRAAAFYAEQRNRLREYDRSGEREARRDANNIGSRVSENPAAAAARQNTSANRDAEFFKRLADEQLQKEAARPEHVSPQRDFTQAPRVPTLSVGQVAASAPVQAVLNNPIARGVQAVATGGRDLLDRGLNELAGVRSRQQRPLQGRVAPEPIDPNRPRLAEFLSSDDADEQRRVSTAYAEAIAAGKTPAEAREAAFSKLGGVSQVVGSALTDPTTYLGGLGLTGRAGQVARGIERLADPLGEAAFGVAGRAARPAVNAFRGLATGPFSPAMGVRAGRVFSGPGTPIRTVGPDGKPQTIETMKLDTLPPMPMSSVPPRERIDPAVLEKSQAALSGASAAQATPAPVAPTPPRVVAESGAAGPPKKGTLPKIRRLPDAVVRQAITDQFTRTMRGQGVTDNKVIAQAIKDAIDHYRATGQVPAGVVLPRIGREPGSFTETAGVQTQTPPAPLALNQQRAPRGGINPMDATGRMPKDAEGLPLQGGFFGEQFVETPWLDADAAQRIGDASVSQGKARTRIARETPYRAPAGSGGPEMPTTREGEIAMRERNIAVWLSELRTTSFPVRHGELQDLIRAEREAITRLQEADVWPQRNRQIIEGAQDRIDRIRTRQQEAVSPALLTPPIVPSRRARPGQAPPPRRPDFLQTNASATEPKPSAFIPVAGAGTPPPPPLEMGPFPEADGDTLARMTEHYNTRFEQATETIRSQHAAGVISRDQAIATYARWKDWHAAQLDRLDHTFDPDGALRSDRTISPNKTGLNALYHGVLEDIAARESEVIEAVWDQAMRPPSEVPGRRTPMPRLGERYAAPSQQLLDDALARDGQLNKLRTQAARFERQLAEHGDKQGYAPSETFPEAPDDPDIGTDDAPQMPGVPKEYQPAYRQTRRVPQSNVAPMGMRPMPEMTRSIPLEAIKERGMQLAPDPSAPGLYRLRRSSLPGEGQTTDVPDVLHRDGSGYYWSGGGPRDADDLAALRYEIVDGNDGQQYLVERVADEGSPPGRRPRFNALDDEMGTDTFAAEIDRAQQREAGEAEFFDTDEQHPDSAFSGIDATDVDNLDEQIARERTARATTTAGRNWQWNMDDDGNMLDEQGRIVGTPGAGPPSRLPKPRRTLAEVEGDRRASDVYEQQFEYDTTDPLYQVEQAERDSAAFAIAPPPRALGPERPPLTTTPSRLPRGFHRPPPVVAPVARPAPPVLPEPAPLPRLTEPELWDGTNAMSIFPGGVAPAPPPPMTSEQLAALWPLPELPDLGIVNQGLPGMPPVPGLLGKIGRAGQAINDVMLGKRTPFDPTNIQLMQTPDGRWVAAPPEAAPPQGGLGITPPGPSPTNPSSHRSLTTESDLGILWNAYDQRKAMGLDQDANMILNRIIVVERNQGLPQSEIPIPAGRRNIFTGEVSTGAPAPQRSRPASGLGSLGNYAAQQVSAPTAAAAPRTGGLRSGPQAGPRTPPPPPGYGASRFGGPRGTNGPANLSPSPLSSPGPVSTPVPTVTSRLSDTRTHLDPDGVVTGTTEGTNAHNEVLADRVFDARARGSESDRAERQQLRDELTQLNLELAKERQARQGSTMGKVVKGALGVGGAVGLGVGAYTAYHLPNQIANQEAFIDQGEHKDEGDPGHLANTWYEAMVKAVPEMKQHPDSMDVMIDFFLKTPRLDSGQPDFPTGFRMRDEYTQWIQGGPMPSADTMAIIAGRGMQGPMPQPTATPTATVGPGTATPLPPTPTATLPVGMPPPATTATPQPGGPAAYNVAVSQEMGARIQAVFDSNYDKGVIHEAYRYALQNPREAHTDAMRANWISYPKGNNPAYHPTLWEAAMAAAPYPIPTQYAEPPGMNSPEFNALPTSNPATPTPYGAKVQPAPAVSVAESRAGEPFRPSPFADVQGKNAPPPPPPYRDPGTQPGGPAATGGRTTPAPTPAPAAPTAPVVPTYMPPPAQSGGSGGGGGRGAPSGPAPTIYSPPRPGDSPYRMIGGVWHGYDGTKWVPSGGGGGGGGGGQASAPSGPSPTIYSPPRAGDSPYRMINGAWHGWDGSSWVPSGNSGGGGGGPSQGSAAPAGPAPTIYSPPRAGDSPYRMIDGAWHGWTGEAWVASGDGSAPAQEEAVAQPKWMSPGAFPGETTIFYDAEENRAYQIVWDPNELSASGEQGAWVPMPDPFAREPKAATPGRTVYDPPIGDESPIRKLPEGWAAWDGETWILTEDAADSGGGGGYSGGGGGGGGGYTPRPFVPFPEEPREIKYWGDLTPQDQEKLRLFFAAGQGRPLAEGIAKRLGISLARLSVMFNLGAQWTYRPTAPVRTRWMG